MDCPPARHGEIQINGRRRAGNDWAVRRILSLYRYQHMDYPSPKEYNLFEFFGYLFGVK